METAGQTAQTSNGRVRHGGGLEKRSVRIAGLRTSVALEPPFWKALEAIARAKRLTMPSLLAAIDARRKLEAPDRNLASAARVYALRNRPD